MWDEKLFGELPIELAEVGKLEINYTSQIAKAQKESELDAFPKFLGVMGPIIQMKPEIMDNMNQDEFFRHNWSTVGLPEKSLYDESAVRRSREARAQDMQKQQQMMQEQHDAEVSSKVAPNMLEAQKMQQGQA
jgi:hypothetical protein